MKSIVRAAAEDVCKEQHARILSLAYHPNYVSLSLTIDSTPPLFCSMGFSEQLIRDSESLEPIIEDRFLVRFGVVK